MPITAGNVGHNSLGSFGNVDGADFRARIDLLASLGYTVMISDYVLYFRLRVAEVLAGLRRGRGAWMEDVPAGVSERIIEGRLLGFDTE